MSESKNTDLAKREVTEEALMEMSSIQGTMDRPKGLDPNDLSGTEDIDLNEIKLPRLAIAQGLSKQIIPGEGVYIQGLAIGQMFNDVTSTVYGNGPLTVVPILRRVSRIEFDPDNKGVPLDRNVPANDPRMQWTKDPNDPTGKKGIPPRATEYVEFICWILQPGKRPDPVVVSIKTTNKYQRAAADLWTTLVGTRRSAIYTGLYHISSKMEKGKNKEGQETIFGVFIVKNAGYIPMDTPVGAALVAQAKAFHEELKGKNITVNRDEEDSRFDGDAIEAELVAERSGK